jgi:hypothetical protein
VDAGALEDDFASSASGRARLLGVGAGRAQAGVDTQAAQAAEGFSTEHISLDKPRALVAAALAAATVLSARHE